MTDVLFTTCGEPVTDKTLLEKKENHDTKARQALKQGDEK